MERMVHTRHVKISGWRSDNLRLTSHAMTGTGGSFTPSVDDFFVDEIPLYDASGEGDHCYVRLTKRGLNTRDVIHRIIERFGVDERDIGTAGMKDKYATTTQTFSVLGIDSVQAESLQDDDIDVLSARRHRNKLKTGHLRGNRFRLRLAGVDANAESAARTILGLLSSQGMANYFGPQRFGRYGDNAQLGRSLLLKKRPRIGRWKARLLISALQSALFNAYLERRMEDGSIVRAYAGDVMRKCESGGQFICSEPEVDQLRIDQAEISPTGPMFGWKMKSPSNGTVPHSWEMQILAEADLSTENFRTAKRIAEGTRRPIRVFVEEPEVVAEGDDLWVSFSLPSGSYATAVVAELTQQPMERACFHSP